MDIYSGVCVQVLSAEYTQYITAGGNSKGAVPLSDAKPKAADRTIN
ncbi:hypothetical protein [Nitrincola sp. MINF-07-Sa-05]